MQNREKLMNYFNRLQVKEIDMPNKKIKGLYSRNKYIPNGMVLLNNNYDYYSLNGVLAEEIGHHATSHGNILDNYSTMQNIMAAKQEVKARRFGYDLILPLDKLIECFENGIWDDVYEICLHLEIDRSYFNEIIHDYKLRFGNYVKYNGYTIEFEPLNIYKKSKGE